jgi:hypothetical protein
MRGAWIATSQSSVRQGANAGDVADHLKAINGVRSR